MIAGRNLPEGRGDVISASAADGFSRAVRQTSPGCTTN